MISLHNGEVLPEEYGDHSQIGVLIKAFPLHVARSSGGGGCMAAVFVLTEASLGS